MDSHQEVPKFIIDQNVGKLKRWLRMMGYDTIFFTGADDGEMVETALNENRILLTRDTQIMKRSLVSSGKIKVLLFNSDQPWQQLKKTIKFFNLRIDMRSFTRCLECNEPVHSVAREKIENTVPPYVYRTQSEYTTCPRCQRIYWRGTHWQAMQKMLQEWSNETFGGESG